VKPGSEEAQQVKAALTAEGMWSQYLEVGIGPDAEVFSKAQMLSSVGYGAEVGLHPISNSRYAHAPIGRLWHSLSEFASESGKG
jgi:fumarylacetoacetate (FAA) hydrolase family protein